MWDNLPQNMQLNTFGKKNALHDIPWAFRVKSGTTNRKQYMVLTNPQKCSHVLKLNQIKQILKYQLNSHLFK